VKQLAGKPFVLLGVHGFDYPSAKLKVVMEREQLNWRSFSSRAIAARWSARGTPTYYIIDASGVIQSKWVGYPGVKAIDEALDKPLKEAEGKAKTAP
jgi:hypothetical protein